MPISWVSARLRHLIAAAAVAVHLCQTVAAAVRLSFSFVS